MKVIDSQGVLANLQVGVYCIEPAHVCHASFLDDGKPGVNAVAVQESSSGKFRIGRVPVPGFAQDRGYVETFAFAFVVFLEADDVRLLLLDESKYLVFDFPFFGIGRPVEIEQPDIVCHQFDISRKFARFGRRFGRTFDLQGVLQVPVIEQQACQKKEAAFP